MSARTSMFDLTDRVALVTGSSRGIGLALARGLLAAGARVVLHGRDRERLRAPMDALVAQFGAERVGSVVFDITAADAAEAAVEEIERDLGPLRILVNNAGLQFRAPMLELEADDWRRVIDTDLTGAFLVGRAAARRMLPRGVGKIVNIASVQSDLARPTIAPYAAAKGGLRNLTRAMAAEWAGGGLQVNAIAPGYIHTEMTQALVDDPAFNGWILGRTPAARWGTTEDLVGPLLWLASDGSDFVNGQTVFVDGGMTVVV